MNLPQIARASIEGALKGKHFTPSPEDREQYDKPGASFVTLTKRGELRGCIGSLLAHQSLIDDVSQNACNAAFEDPRFPPVREAELGDIHIEVSILSEPKKISFRSPQDLLSKVNPTMGIILRKGPASATFLPQVWEELPAKVDFFEHLSIKAGLPKDGWKNAEVSYYTVDVEEESF